MTDYQKLLDEQKEYFHTNATKTLEWRKSNLTKLENMIKENEEAIIECLKLDLGKSKFESYLTEIGVLLNSIKSTKKNVASWMKPKKAHMPLYQFGSTGKIIYEPYGSILIIGPFNLPFELLMEPLVAAFASGNTAILKPSEYTPNTSNLIERLISQTFDKKIATVIQGDKDVTNALIHMPFDHIFFTGSVPVGKIVMEAASKNLTPVTLELGGKSPTIIDDSANLEVAAKRIAWGKFLNSGQVCIAPDYVYVSERRAEEFISKLKKVITDFYGDSIHESEDFGRIVSSRHFNRLKSLIDDKKVVFGGNTIESQNYIQPTIMYPVKWEDKVMEDEIFGPILPILTYKNLNEVINEVRSRPKPLALYLFTENKSVEDRIMNELSFGGGCINDTINHSSVHDLPFGGVGNSGLGNYHGKYGFLTLSHAKPVLKKSTKIDLSILFPPYKGKLNTIKRALK